MASILDKYGIKEVADVTFYKLENGEPTVPVLYLDTCKATTIEQTGEEADARGGKGNAILMSWDYNKEITITLEDALFSAKSMAIMFGGNETVNQISNTLLMKTEEFKANATTSVKDSGTGAWNSFGWDSLFTAPTGVRYGKVNPKFYSAAGERVTSVTSGEKYFCTYDLIVDGGVIEISANSFPGTYYVTGDTYARPQGSTNDEFFQFIVSEAKVQAENTITLEADGDPTTFSMNLKVLKPADGKPMMKLVKYNPVDDYGTGTGATWGLVHNHNLGDGDDTYLSSGVDTKITPKKFSVDIEGIVTSVSA